MAKSGGATTVNGQPKLPVMGGRHTEHGGSDDVVEDVRRSRCRCRHLLVPERCTAEI